jgi:hypothetical protein
MRPQLLVKNDTVIPLNSVLASVGAQDLDENARDLDAYGFTVVQPEKVAPPAFHDRLREAVLQVHERRTGQRITDLSEGTGPVPSHPRFPHGQAAHFFALFEDPAFQEALLNPAVLAMARYLCGASAVLSDFLAVMRGQADAPPILLHNDTAGIPAPLPPFAQTCNVTWILTDYTENNGPVAIVPGSHRFCRQPGPHEENGFAEDAAFKPIPVEAKAGSLIVWHGNTWHGVWPRRNPGTRLNLLMYFSRGYLRPLVDYRAHTPKEMVADNPELSRVLGFDLPYPIRFDGDSMDPEGFTDKIEAYSACAHDQWR